MFDLFKRSSELLAPISGKIIDLGDVPDDVFAGRLAGDGVAIDSTGDYVAAPGNGVLKLVFRTNHAFGMLLDDGIEVLIHIGLDTVELDGCGFLRLANEGDTVKAGDPIIRLDRELIISRGYSLITPVLITNFNIVKSINYNRGAYVEAGKDIVLEYKLR